MSENMTQALNWILSESTEEDLEKIIEAIKQRRARLASVAMSQLKLGQNVTIGQITPKILTGMTGTIRAFSTRGNRCTILLDEKCTKELLALGYGRRFWIPEGTERAEIDKMPMQVLVPSQ